MQQLSGSAWPVNDRFLELRSHWMTLIGEHLQDDRGQLLEYWRVEKADSVIVLPVQNSMILLTRLTPLNSEGWAVNSSFSNQKLYGFSADIDGGLSTSELLTYPANAIGVKDLLDSLTCLQCRTVLLEWWLKQIEG